AIQDHLLLIGAQTHGSTSWAAAEDRAIFPDLNAKYSAAKSRVSSLPVSTVRATRCAETMTGVMPPPGCVQWPTRERFLTGVVLGRRCSASWPGDISHPSIAPCQLLVKRKDVMALALSLTTICESMPGRIWRRRPMM